MRWHKPQGRNELTVERLRSILDYNPETGKFWWTKNYSGRIRPFRVRHGEAYLKISIDGKAYLAHRLAWFHVHGQWPDGNIDHIDHNRTNNAISNLRIATQSQNSANSRIATNNTSGVKGVSKNDKAFSASLAGKSLGSFATIDEAAAAYARAAKETYSEFANPDRGEARRDYANRKYARRRRKGRGPDPMQYRNKSEIEMAIRKTRDERR